MTFFLLVKTHIGTGHQYLLSRDNTFRFKPFQFILLQIVCFIYDLNLAYLLLCNEISFIEKQKLVVQMSPSPGHRAQLPV